MWVRRDTGDGSFRANQLAPDGGPGFEELTINGFSIFRVLRVKSLFFGCLGILFQVEIERFVADTQSAQVANVFTQGELTVDIMIWGFRGREDLILIDQ